MNTREAVDYIRTTTAIRERCGQILSLGQKGALAHFQVCSERLPGLVLAVREEMKLNYPDLRVPFHSRWRHFHVGGVDREAILDLKLKNLSALEKARAKFELAIVSVLLDAGAGDQWTYHDSDCRRRFGRSEGLAVASFNGFCDGSFGEGAFTVTSEALLKFDRIKMDKIFQISDDNPLLGVEGRVDLLNQLGEVIRSNPEAFSGSPGRLGGMIENIASLADPSGIVHGAVLLRFILDTFSPIWPGRITLGGKNLGDVWKHSQVVGLEDTNQLVPFHKLSQWLTYSLLEPLAEAGIRVGYLDELTGLAEYRNGGLLIDSGLLELRDSSAIRAAHAPSAELIVEWRALTVSFLDVIASRLRSELGQTPDELPLAKVLQGGTWSLGRKFAAERRPHAAPPLVIESDGTVF